MWNWADIRCSGSNLQAMFLKVWFPKQLQQHLDQFQHLELVKNADSQIWPQTHGICSPGRGGSPVSYHPGDSDAQHGLRATGLEERVQGEGRPWSRQQVHAMLMVRWDAQALERGGNKPSSAETERRTTRRLDSGEGGGAMSLRDPRPG